MFDARKVFDGNHAAFSIEAGTPISSIDFRKEYITPAYERSNEEGAAIDEAYGLSISDYQRDGFVVGFNAAMQLFMSCAGQRDIATPHIYIPQKDEENNA